MFNLFFLMFSFPSAAIWMLLMFPFYVKFRRGEDIGPYMMMLSLGWIPVLAVGAIGSSIYLNASSEDSFLATVEDVDEVCSSFCLNRADKVVVSTEGGGRYQFSYKDSGVIVGDRIKVVTRQDPMRLATEFVDLSLLPKANLKPDPSPVIDAVPLGE